jgi:hypothetical protein
VHCTALSARLNLLYKPMPHDTGPGVLGVKEVVERKKRWSLVTASCNAPPQYPAADGPVV